MNRQSFNVDTTIFTRLARLACVKAEEGFFSQITGPSDKKSNYRTYAEGCQMPFSFCKPVENPLLWEDLS